MYTRESGIRRLALFAISAVVLLLAACSATKPHRYPVTADDGVECGVVAALRDNRCHARTPEVSERPPYTLHFVEFDDQGWLYPDVPEMRKAHEQLGRAIDDVRRRLDAGKRVLLLVFVHGWKHSAAFDDRDVTRFRQMLADAAELDSIADRADPGLAPSGPGGERSIVGIYVGWRGAGSLSPGNPLINLTFWTRKNAALHVSAGASRELFARIRSLRARVNTADGADPSLRTVVIGHSFGAWIAFSALSPSILELLSSPVDRGLPPKAEQARITWRRERLRHTADIIVLINPAFEATRYQPVHYLAQNLPNHLELARYEPPLLLVITSTADRATRIAFPAGRFVNALFQRPFVSDEQELAAERTPGFMAAYQTHALTRPALAVLRRRTHRARPGQPARTGLEHCDRRQHDQEPQRPDARTAARVPASAVSRLAKVSHR